MAEVGDLADGRAPPKRRGGRYKARKTRNRVKVATKVLGAMLTLKRLTLVLTARMGCMERELGLGVVPLGRGDREIEG